MAEIETIDVGGTIRLGQFLKLANVSETGGMSRELVAAGLVTVNGEVDLRRGRQLAAGDVVRIDTGDQVVELRVG